MDTLKAQIAGRNDGMLATYHASNQSLQGHGGVQGSGLMATPSHETASRCSPFTAVTLPRRRRAAIES